MIEVEMTSLEIAELTGKKHQHVRRDIKDKLLPEISLSKNGQSDFVVKTSTYLNDRNKEYALYILNKNAANVLVANYKMGHAIKVIQKLIDLEKQVVQQQEELDTMKGIVWDVINGQSYIAQEQALKMAGIKHPRLFIKYLKKNSTFFSSTIERNLLHYRQCNSHGDKWLKFSKEGFKWLLEGKTTLNNWVEKCKTDLRYL